MAAIFRALVDAIIGFDSCSYLAAKEQVRHCQGNGKTYHVDSICLVWRMRCDEGALLEVVLRESRRSSRRRSEEEEEEARLKSRSCEKLRVFAH